MKIVTVWQLNIISNRKLRIYEELDDDYPNWKKVRANERAIDYWLAPYSKEERKELDDNIQFYRKWEVDAELLKSLGWKVIFKQSEEGQKFFNELYKKEKPK